MPLREATPRLQATFAIEREILGCAFPGTLMTPVNRT